MLLAVARTVNPETGSDSRSSLSAEQTEQRIPAEEPRANLGPNFASGGDHDRRRQGYPNPERIAARARTRSPRSRPNARL